MQSNGIQNSGMLGRPNHLQPTCPPWPRRKKDAGLQRTQDQVVRVTLPTLLEPGNQVLAIDRLQRSKTQTTQTSSLIGFDKRLLLLRGEAQTTAPVGFENHFIHIRHGGRIYDG